MVEAHKDLRDAVMQENKRIRDLAAEDKKVKKEELEKRMEEIKKKKEDEEKEVFILRALISRR